MKSQIIAIAFFMLVSPCLAIVGLPGVPDEEYLKYAEQFPSSLAISIARFNIDEPRDFPSTASGTAIGPCSIDKGNPACEPGKEYEVSHFLVSGYQLRYLFTSKGERFTNRSLSGTFEDPHLPPSIALGEVHFPAGFDFEAINVPPVFSNYHDDFAVVEIRGGGAFDFRDLGVEAAIFAKEPTEVGDQLSFVGYGPHASNGIRPGGYSVGPSGLFYDFRKRAGDNVAVTFSASQNLGAVTNDLSQASALPLEAAPIGFDSGFGAFDTGGGVYNEDGLLVGFSLGGTPRDGQAAAGGESIFFKLHDYRDEILAMQGFKADGPCDFENWSRGDFNCDQLVNAIDANLLAEAIASGSNDTIFDFNADAVINSLDEQGLITEGIGALAGDANLDLSVTFTDFLTLSENFGSEGGWTQGDFDFSGDVAFSDFLALSENFGQTSAAPVPEPSGVGMIVVAMFALVLNRKNSYR